MDAFVQTKILTDGMYVYRSTDFEGFGRALGYGEQKPDDKGWEPKKKIVEVLGSGHSEDEVIAPMVDWTM